MSIVLAVVAVSCFVGMVVVVRRCRVISGRLDRVAAENRRLRSRLEESGEVRVTPWINREPIPLRKPRRISEEG